MFWKIFTACVFVSCIVLAMVAAANDEYAKGAYWLGFAIINRISISEYD